MKKTKRSSEKKNEWTNEYIRSSASSKYAQPFVCVCVCVFCMFFKSVWRLLCVCSIYRIRCGHIRHSTSRAWNLYVNHIKSNQHRNAETLRNTYCRYKYTELIHTWTVGICMFVKMMNEARIECTIKRIHLILYLHIIYLYISDFIMRNDYVCKQQRTEKLNHKNTNITNGGGRGTGRTQ
jgi:hypothetical protein